RARAALPVGGGAAAPEAPGCDDTLGAEGSGVEGARAGCGGAVPCAPAGVRRGRLPAGAQARRRRDGGACAPVESVAALRGGARVAPMSAGRRPAIEPRLRASVRIASAAYAFPAASRTLRELAAVGALESDPALLANFGFERVRVACQETPYDMARSAAGAVLARAGVEPESVGLVVYGGTPAP